MEQFNYLWKWLTQQLFNTVEWSSWLLQPAGWIALMILVGIAAFLPARCFAKMVTVLFWFFALGAFFATTYFWHRWGWWTGALWLPALSYILIEEDSVAKEAKRVCALGGFEWDRNDFCRGWLITGATGCGKTQSAINNLMHQVFRNEPNWGGVCIDEKGLYYAILVDMAKTYGREKDLMLLQTKPVDAPDDWKPPAIFNILSDNAIPSGTYATAICETSATLAGGEGDKGFFKTQAHLQIQKGIDLLRVLGRPPTMSDLLEIIQTKDRLKACLSELQPFIADKNDPRYKAAFVVNDHFDGFLKQPADQLGGVISTVQNYLAYFTHPEVAQIFSDPNQTFSLGEIDAGKIVCVAMPQKFSNERRYVNTILKFLYYQHARNRFDQGKELKSGRKNMLVLWQDEAQRFITPDDGNVDVIREASATTVMASQAQSSLIPPLGGKEKASVVLLNLRNRIIMQSATRECAEMSADFIGKAMVWKKSYSTQGGGKGSTVSRSEEEQYVVKPHELLDPKFLPQFNAIVCHASKGWKKVVMPPVAPDGCLPPWYSGTVPGWFREWTPSNAAHHRKAAAKAAKVAKRKAELDAKAAEKKAAAEAAK